jgi:hypothetical protein
MILIETRGTVDTVSYTGSADTVQPTHLTPEMILAMVRRQLNQMDDQIKNAMEVIQDRRQRAESLGGQIQRIRELQSALRDCEHIWDGDTIRMDRLNDPEAAALRAAIGLANHSDDDVIIDRFQAVCAELGLEISTADRGLPVSVIEQKIDTLTEQQRVANSENEMLFMQLQSAVQQRSQIIQLGTNMLKSVDDAVGSVIGNMR